MGFLFNSSSTTIVISLLAASPAIFLSNSSYRLATLSLVCFTNSSCLFCPFNNASHLCSSAVSTSAFGFIIVIVLLPLLLASAAGLSMNFLLDPMPTASSLSSLIFLIFSCFANYCSLLANKVVFSIESPNVLACKPFT